MLRARPARAAGGLTRGLLCSRAASKFTRASSAGACPCGALAVAVAVVEGVVEGVVAVWVVAEGGIYRQDRWKGHKMILMGRNWRNLLLLYTADIVLPEKGPREKDR